MVTGRVSGEYAVPMVQGSLNQSEDAVSKNLRKQIENAKKQLSDLAANKEISVEEKMKRRQEIQQEITSLNQELRQHQIEVKREQQQEKAQKAADNSSAQKGLKEERQEGLSGEGQQALIGADVAMKQASMCDSVEISMEGRARVLASEIELDSSRRCADTTRKREELSDIEERMQNVAKAQASALADASEKMEDTRSTDNKNTVDEKEDADRKEEDREEEKVRAEEKEEENA